MERIKKELIKYWKEEAKKRGTLEEFARWRFWFFYYLGFANFCVCFKQKIFFFQDHAVTQSLPLLWLRRGWGGNFKYRLSVKREKIEEQLFEAKVGVAYLVAMLPCCLPCLKDTPGRWTGLPPSYYLSNHPGEEGEVRKWNQIRGRAHIT